MNFVRPTVHLNAIAAPPATCARKESICSDPVAMPSAEER